MSDVIGRGVIEVSADAGKLNASIAEARRSIASLGDANQSANAKSSASIDRYVSRLQVSQKTIAMTAREAELYKLSLRGASDEQLRAANSALRMTEAYKFGQDIGDKLKAAGILAATGLLAASVAFDQLLKKTGEFQDMAEKIGDTAENVASLALAAAGGGASMEEVTAASARMTQALTGVNDESKAAGAAIAALGLNMESFKKLSPADQIEAVAKAMAKFDESKEKTAVAMALFGEAGAKTMPFLRELGKEGARQVILTQQQIDLADEYADKQAVLVGQISLHAQSLALEMLPAVNDLVGAFDDLLKSYVDTNKGATDLANNHAIEDFADAAVSALAFVVDAGDGVARVFELAGKSIAAATVIATSPIQQSKAIFQSWQDDMDAILSRPQLGQLLEQRRAARKSEQQQSLDAGDSANPTAEKRTLNFDGANTANAASKNAATALAAEAKARLAADLAEIKSAGDAIASAYDNAEKIMEARRAAGLIDDRQYYEAKAGFINLSRQAQESELQSEIARLQAEKATGKERLDNDRKIAEAQAKLVKVRDDASTESITLSIQEAAANQKLAQSYIDATTAANAYIQTIIERNALEVDGIGKGSKYRAEQAGRNEIEDKFTGQRQGLERDLRNGQINRQQFDDYLAVAQATYEQEVALYNARTSAIDAKQGDWTTGAMEAMRNYADEAANVAKQTEDLFTNAFGSMEDALVSFVKTGKFDFNSLAESILADLVRIQARAAMASLTSGLDSWMSGLFQSSSVTLSDGSLFSAALSGARAGGGPVSSGGTYLVGEKGPELLTMGAGSGHITPNNALGGSSVVNVNVINNANGTQATQSTRQDAGGATIIDVMIETVKSAIAQDIGSGGMVAGAMESQYGLNRSAGAWR